MKKFNWGFSQDIQTIASSSVSCLTRFCGRNGYQTLHGSLSEPSLCPSILSTTL